MKLSPALLCLALLGCTSSIPGTSDDAAETVSTVLQSAPSPDPEFATSGHALTAAEADEPYENGPRHLMDIPDTSEHAKPLRRWRKKAVKVQGAFGTSKSALTVGSVTYPVVDPIPLPGLQPGPYKLEQWVDRSVDCVGTHRVAGKNLAICDYAPAFDRIFLDVSTNLGSVDFDWLGYGDKTGTRIEVPAGLLWLSHTVQICRQMIIQGVSGGFGGATGFYTPHSSGAFKISYYDECVAAGLGEGGTDTIIRDMNILEANGADPTTQLVAGIQMDSRARLENLYIYGFVQGVRISADVTRTPRTNANGWGLYNVQVTNPEHAGIYVDGGDANIGLALQPNVVGGCIRGSYWSPTLGPCADHVYSDFLGSTVIASHASGSYDHTTNVNFSNFIGSDGASARGVYLGMYSENDAELPAFGPVAMCIGNTCKTGIGGHREVGDYMSSVQIVNDKDPLNVVTVTMGSLASGGSAIEFKPSGPNGTTMTQPLRLKADPTNLRWRADVGNLNPGSVLIGGAAAATGGFGAVTFPLADSIGSAAIQMQVSTGTPAASLCSVTSFGAFYFERQPSKTGPAFYECAKLTTSPVTYGWRSGK